MTFHSILRSVAAALLLSLLAACGSAPSPSLPPPPPLALVDPDTACLRDLEAVNAAFQPLASFGEGNCSIANPVRLSGSATIMWSRPGILSCPMARTLTHFEADTVQPLAAKYFGQPVRKLLHLGTYDCRSKRNNTTDAEAAKMGISKGGRLSEHAQGRAIDFAGIELADGSVVTVKKDWHGNTAAGHFLRDLARESCRTFNVVLTPNHDRLHHDHIHLDIGPHTLCGI